LGELDGTQTTTLKRPVDDDRLEWNEYWKSLGQPWRTEPEISKERQDYLAERCNIKPDYSQGIIPFKDIKLSRADVEWLLLTLDNNRGPINWNNERQSEREGLDLSLANLCQVDLSKLPIAKCNLSNSQIEGALFISTQLQHAKLINAQLYKANLFNAQLQGANLSSARLQGANLKEAEIQGANMSIVILADENQVGPHFADVKWGDTNLAVVDWAQITMLGDEHRASLDKNSNTAGFKYRTATRANRQLSVALRNQGLNEEAARFTYRAQLMQRKVFWYERKYLSYLGSLFLDLLSGYGYKPLRCFIAYLIVIFTFATAYFIIGHTVGPVLSPLGSVVFSMTSFHGRGFFPGGIALDDPLTVLAAFEAFIGLLIEVTFIATLTQRLFGR
jgi:uncharacterized protein YjbI with pentapeptide repeats